MNFPRPRRARYEGLVYFEVVDEHGEARRHFDTEKALAARLAPKCGECCHPEHGSVFVIGRVVDGKINGRPLDEFVSRLED